jgi:hypothetical protein
MVSYSSSARQNGPCGPTTPQRQRLPAVTSLRFSLFRFRSPLLPESLLFSLPVGTEMFHFPTFPPDALCVQAQVPGLSSRWVSPFGHPRITGRLSPSRGFSQTPTSFIGSRCQGIHHVHLVACCYYKDARVHCEVLKIRSVPQRVLAGLASHQVVRGCLRSGGPTLGADPSGPNSVPESSLCPAEVPSCKSRCTDGVSISDEPNSRRPLMSCVAQDERLRTTRHWTSSAEAGLPIAP